MAKNDSFRFEDEPKDAQSLVQLINEFFDLRLTGTPDNNDPTARELRVRMQPDGTVRAYALQVYLDESGDERYAVIGPDGQQFMGQFIYDSAAGAWVEMMGEPTGEQRNVIAGKDAGGNIDELRTNASQQLQVEVVSSSGKNPHEAVAIPAAEADVWGPGTTSASYYDVEFEIVNVDGAADATNIDIGVDYGDSSGAIDRYFVNNITVAHSEVGTRIGPYRIWGDDQIRAVCNAANDAELHIYVVDEGTI